MKEFRLFIFLLLSVIVVPLSSCDDDDDDDIVAPSRMEMLTAGEWTGTAFYIGGADSTQWVLDSLGIDMKMWKLRFDRNGNYTSSIEGLFTESGKWEFANNEQDIIFDKGDPVEEETARIARLTSTELYLDETLEVEYDDGSTGELEAEMRFGR